MLKGIFQPAVHPVRYCPQISALLPSPPQQIHYPQACIRTPQRSPTIPAQHPRESLVQAEGGQWWQSGMQVSSRCCGCCWSRCWWRCACPSARCCPPAGSPQPGSPCRPGWGGGGTCKPAQICIALREALPDNLVTHPYLGGQKPTGHAFQLVVVIVPQVTCSKSVDAFAAPHAQKSCCAGRLLCCIPGCRPGALSAA